MRGMAMSEQVRARASTRSPRIARRRQRMRDALLAAGARQFEARGIGAVSVEDLIAEADLSRATFYEIFSSKYEILEALLNPVFETAAAAFARLRALPPLEALHGIIDAYLELWRSHHQGMKLIAAVDAASFRHFEARHRELNGALLELLTRAEHAGVLRNGSAHYSQKVIARTAVALLRVYDGHPATEAMFRDAMSALLIRTH
jgi:AcrR family transcriptional regulator